MKMNQRPAPDNKSMPKFIFANQLRGIAAILVVMTHYFGTYFAEQQLLATRTFSPDMHWTPARWVHLFELAYQGPFGVAVFFLISGFVIPFSLAKSTAPGFLLNRALRILPTYGCCLGIGLLAIYISALYWKQNFHIDTGIVIANALLVHNLWGMPSLDSINWTLAIEFKFYLLAALISGAFFRKQIAWLLWLLALIPLYTWSYPLTPLVPRFNTPMTALAMDLNYIIFMFAGTMFYQHSQALISAKALVFRVLLILAVFGANWSMGPQQSQFPGITLFYYCGTAAFAICYCFRARFRPVKILDFFADISYPLYAVHSLFGYSLLKLLMGNGTSFGAAVLSTLPCTILLAYVIHRTVEVTSNRLGKRLSSALWRRRESRQTAVA